MTNNFYPPITPPPELVREWAKTCSSYEVPADHIATQAANWGFKQHIELDAAELEAKLQKARDEELEACCKAFEDIWDQEDVVTLTDVLRGIRAARRPKPPSLKELNLKHLEVMERDGHYLPEIIADLRRAIESLPS